MEDVAKVSGLVKRKNVYRYRTRIPKDLQSTYGNKIEVSESLHTSNYVEATSLAKIAAGKWATAFEETRHAISNAKIALEDTLIAPPYCRSPDYQ
jgi:hypothetical protein